MFSNGLTQVTHIYIFVSHTKTMYACQLSAPTLPAHLLSLSIPLSVTRFKLVVVALTTFLA
ncbi:unnamed protein product [Hymenolepis diminuta]|uniref:Uncharacterized protein n=1 Tax=Hymenolepis diminuta TaxID=6216 RepID=A0A564Z7P6_HYMDI|nr:unnamed protein product [Hymenolepis diminuta]